jgi:small-conductance mechanosensitive channel
MNKVIITVCLIMSVYLGVGVLAQDEKPAEPEQVQDKGYPVKLGNRTLLYLKDVKGLPTQERANSIMERIEAVADDPRVPVDSITTSTYPQPITMITANDELLMSVLEEDAKALGRSREELAAQYSAELRKAIEQYREERSMKWIIRGALYTLVATMVLIAALYFLTRFHRKITASVQEKLQKKKDSVLDQTFEIVKRERVMTMITRALGFIRLLIVVILFYFYIQFVLNFFPWTRGYDTRILDFVFRPLVVLGKAFWLQIPNLFFVAVIFLITHYSLRLLHLFFKEVERGTITVKGFYPEWSHPTFRIVRLLFLAFAAVLAFPYIPGSGSPAFKGISIFAGVLISLGSTSFISNIIAGYTLTYRRVFKIGDRVQIGDITGDVSEIRLQVTHLQSIKNEEIIVPNSVIVNSNVVNYTSLSKQGGLILHTSVTIGYDTPWRQVHALLLMAAQRTPGLMKEPSPFVLQTSLDDFYVAYELNVYIDDPHEMARLYSELHKNIQDTFNEYGVQIMSPAYEFDPAQPKIVPKEQWYTPPAEPPGSSDDSD